MKNPGRIELVYPRDGTPDDESWLRLVGANGNIVLTSEMYANRSNARRAAKVIAKWSGLQVRDAQTGKVLVEAEPDLVHG